MICLSKLKNAICQVKIAQFAANRLLGERNGRRFGIVSNIVQKNVVNNDVSKNKMKHNGNHIMKIRLLTADDWQIWKEIRLEALQNAPESFGSSFEEECNWPDLEFQNGLNRSPIFGVFIENKLVAYAGYYVLNFLKMQHRGVIWGMYTRSEYRKQGIASALMKHIIADAKSKVLQLHLTCVTSNLGAVQFYLRQGFTVYGTEPRALKIGDAFFDEHLMILDLSEQI